MIRNIIITLLLGLSLLPAVAQDRIVKREVTLYNPYKPSLNESKKRSFFPDMTDTAKFKPSFRYDVSTNPYMPVYTVSPIKAAVLQPDPLTKLYKSYVNLGLGSSTSPLAEISITNERSKKGALGFYARHYSNNGNVKLQNGKKVFAGYMDNDASLFGKKFFKSNILGASLDVAQRTRHGYGYDTSIVNYAPTKKSNKLGYTNLGTTVSLASINLDSASFSYDFNFRYNYFYNSRHLYQHNFVFDGIMAKTFRGFYAGSGIEFDYYKIPEGLLAYPKYVFTLSPFLKKSTPQWNFKLGFKADLERNMEENAKPHFYPDLNFGFGIVPSYIYFFTSLTGHLEKNDPFKVIGENPFVVPDGSLFTIPNTSHQIEVTAGFKGNTGLNGNYILSASYSMVDNMLFYTNIVHPDTIFTPYRGNFFAPITDDVEVLNVHGGITGKINDRLSFSGEANYYQYTMTRFEYAWNKPSWDVTAGLKYNLRDKILAGIELTALGKRTMVVNGENIDIVKPEDPVLTIGMPAHVNLNLSAEYRYSKILSFWAKLDNVSYRHYYEWAYYPSQQFLFMLGFTYSL